MSQHNLIFKYESYFRIHDLANCPPKTYKELRLTAYRYIFDDLEDDRNFKNESDKTNKIIRY